MLLHFYIEVEQCPCPEFKAAPSIHTRSPPPRTPTNSKCSNSARLSSPAISRPRSPIFPPYNRLFRSPPLLPALRRGAIPPLHSTPSIKLSSSLLPISSRATFPPRRRISPPSSKI